MISPTIQTGVPIPSKRGGRKRSRTVAFLQQMSVGQSASLNRTNCDVAFISIRALARYHNIKIITRTTADGMDVWRIN